MSGLTPFDFIKSASQSKVNLIETATDPNHTEKEYNAFIVNRGFSYYLDTILHANEMNLAPGLFAAAQYKYYLTALSSKNRFSKWNKSEKDETLDLIQSYYKINRTKAKQYQKLLSEDALEQLKKKTALGGKETK